MNVSGGVEVRHAQKMVYMWGYLPGATTQRMPLLSPVAVTFPGSCYSWNDVCGGGCGFAMALSESGNLITWGSTNDLGQSYLTSGKHGETPEPFPLPPEAYIVKAAAGWAHCVTVTDCGEVYTWGWKECIPSGKVFGEPSIGISLEQDVPGWQSSLSTEQASPCCQASRSTGGTSSTTSGEESTKRRKVSSAKQTAESSSSRDDTLTALPSLVTLNPGVRIASVAAGGRHTLALSDIGQVWGWGYGGEGQLGLGSRIRMVSSPHLVPCIDSSSYGKDRSTILARGRMCSEGQNLRAPGSYVKGIACGGRHSVVITDAGALLTFGWGLYGQCGQGTTDDELSPTCVSSLLGIRIDGVAAGLWHTVCTSAAGDVYVFGGNQFGQLGTGSDQAEVLPRLVDSPNLENMHAKNISCGSRHTALLTGAEKVKKVKFQTLRKEYKMLQMKEGESVGEYFTKLKSLTNQMRANGEAVKDQMVVKKMLRTLTSRFDHVVVAIDESKDLELLKVEELQSSLEAHEQRIQEMTHERSFEEALQAES